MWHAGIDLLVNPRRLPRSRTRAGYARPLGSTVRRGRRSGGDAGPQPFRAVVWLDQRLEELRSHRWILVGRRLRGWKEGRTAGELSSADRTSLRQHAGTCGGRSIAGRDLLETTAALGGRARKDRRVKSVTRCRTLCDRIVGRTARMGDHGVRACGKRSIDCYFYHHNIMAQKRSVLSCRSARERLPTHEIGGRRLRTCGSGRRRTSNRVGA
jgi:hypothetical protein